MLQIMLLLINNIPLFRIYNLFCHIACADTCLCQIRNVIKKSNAPSLVRFLLYNCYTCIHLENGLIFLITLEYVDKLHKKITRDN